jgi:acyl-coenzyme A synthetase/AMP-(fatty) acid ligase/acyl carrier protein
MRKAFGKGVQIVNQYGPSECSMVSTLYIVPPEMSKDAQIVPIGKPIRNVHIYILDKYFHPVPPGVKGELFIGGIGVGKGYWNRPELTAERFLPDPYQPDGRLSRTGYFVRQRPDGTICFLGRADNQVKIRGYRVELGEIEALATECPGVKEAAVVLWGQGGTDKLVAYITMVEGDKQALKENLRTFLSDRLPVIMMPSIFIVLEEMPLTPNHKIDRRALPSPDSMNEPEGYVAPRNKIERRLVSIWQEVLGIEQVGIRDDFFALGGHSLLAVRLMTRIREETGYFLPLILLFKYGTVEGLAENLTSESAASTSNQEIEP